MLTSKKNNKITTNKRKQQMASTGNVKSSQVATVVIDEQNALVTR